MTQSVQVLDGIDHIRLRPAMYVSDVSTPKNLVREIIDNSLDECVNGHSKYLEVTTGIGSGLNFYRVTDHGRGLPLYEMEVKGEVGIAAKFLFTSLFSSGKFTKDNYEISSGLHGIGLTAANALSAQLEVITVSNGQFYRLVFEKGILVDEELRGTSQDGHFTTITSWPDPTIFTSTKVNIDDRSLKIAKSQLPNVTMMIDGECVKPIEFKEIFPEEMIFSKNFEYEYTHSTGLSDVFCKGLKLKVMYNWSKSDYDFRYQGSVNLISVNSGVHIKTIKSLICSSIGQFGIEKSDGETGLRIFVIAFLPDAEFGSQSKEKLERSHSLKHITPIVSVLLDKSLKGTTGFEVLKNKIMYFKEMNDKLSNMEIVKEKVKLGKGNTPSRNLGIGIYECSSRDRHDTELFIVEGDSAGGGLVTKRDRKTQAVLPLRGKTLNVSASENIKRILGNREITAMINSIGAGIRGGEDLNCRRYDRIILISDADPDGLNVTSLILGALAYLTPKLLCSGRVFLIKAPLFKQGELYLNDDNYLDKSKPFSHFKGLGEMPPDDLAFIALNKSNRNLIQLTSSMSEIQCIINLVGTPESKKELMISRGLI